MLGRDNVRAIVTEIIVKLNDYLKQHQHAIVTEEKHSTYPYSIKCNDGNYIVFKSAIPCHNTMLTLERMQNIYHTRNLLNNQLTYLQDDEKSLYQQLTKIHEFLEDGKTRNIQLSNKYSVKHTSYQDGLLALHGKFRSRLNATLTQSEATRTFIASLFLLNDFTSKCQPTVQQPSAPPPPKYSVTHLETPIADPSPVVRI